MRKPKFRAWSNEHNKYCDFVTLNEDGRWIGWIKTCGIFLSTVDIVLEQDTGLNDKNGKPIYQGDIVEALIEGVWDIGKNDIGFGKIKWKLEVIHNENRFEDVFKVIGSRSNPYRIYYLFDQALSELEVIGNVHDNPELLGDTNVTNKEEE